MTDDTTEDTTEEQFSVAQTGPLHYTVLSSRSGQRAHRVNIQTVDCSCEDMTYNRGLAADSDGGREICDHLAYVLERHPQLTAQESALYKAMGIMEGAANLQQQIEDQSDQLEDAIVQLRDAQAGLDASNDAGGESTADSDDSGSEPDDSPPGGMTDEDVAKAAEDLQDAFDNVIDDMQVEHNDGLVWFKTGQNTEEDWPYPGSFDGPDFMTEVERAITSPDVLMYVHDGSADWADGPHKHYESKPGEWFKNALRPEDVDEYISEVLE